MRWERLLDLETYAANVRKVLGAAAVFLGGIIIGFNPGRGSDPLLLHLPGHRHGVTLTDLAGMAVLTVGVVVLWRAPAPRKRPHV